MVKLSSHVTFVRMLEDWVVGPNTTGDDIMTVPPKHIKKLALSRDLKPTIRIGKSGISESLIAEINEQLASKTIVKIKINRGLFDKKDIAEVWNHIAISTNSTIVSSRGNVCIVWKG